jgi:polysaccharide pyruvyl transferase WcaK-like protein
MINLFCIRPKGFNVGNDAIYLGLQHFLYGAFGEVVNLISLPATTKYESHGTAGLTAKTIYEINQYGHGVIVGGGNLYENGELQVDLDALDSLEVPLMLFSLSRGRIYNRQGQLVDRTDALPDRVLRGLDRQASCALFRDQATGQYLRQLGCEHHAVGGCPTIFLDRMAHRLPEIPHTGNRTALVSVRNPNLMSIPLRRQSHVYGDVLAIIEQLTAHGYDDVRLLCHDHRDLAFAASFPDLEYVYTGDVFTYLAMLRQCSLSVGYRLHAFLPCQAFGVPAINISYDERAASLVETVGLGEWNINMIREPDVACQVADRLQRLDDLAALRTRIQPHWNELYQTLAGGFADFARCVREQSQLPVATAHRPPRRAAA